jgi:5-methylcytosine-specific restriction endonuclease McrA|tara:strand:+ start:46 stop:339 length:294 start_codon:yes stop_codon:yes gene_type:complete
MFTLGKIMARDYKKENEYKAQPEQIKLRVARNKARRQAIKDGRVEKGDGKEIDHVIPLSKGGSNTKANTRIRTKSQNSSFSRNSDNSVKKNTPLKKK